MERCIIMTHKELGRLEVIKKTHEKRLKVMKAAEILRLSKRQTLCWSKRLKNEGPDGMISRKRGVSGNHKIANKLKKRALRLTEAKYHDFGPTLAHEHLAEQEGLKLSVCTIRSLFRYKSSKEYLIVGIVGTAVYALFDTVKPFLFGMKAMEAILTNFIAALGIVLIIDFLIRTVVKHRPRPLEKLWSSVCWGVGCLVSLIMEIQTVIKLNGSTQPTITPLISGILASILSFLVILFIEETVWALRNLPKTT